MPGQKWVGSPQVMSEVLEGEAVIIDLASGRYHAAAGAGATVWRAIGAGCALDDILAEVARAHTGVPQDAAEQVQGFIDQLLAAGLIAEAAADLTAAPLGEAPEATPWAAPVLETHDDLADLLLLDPVHEVTEAGWPHAAPPA